MKQYPLVAYFALAFGIAWVIWIPMAASWQGLLPFQIPAILGIILAGCAPTVSAVILTGIESGKNGVDQLLGRFTLWRVGIHWYAFVLLSEAAIGLSAIGLIIVPGGAVELPLYLSQWHLVLPIFLFNGLVAGLMEEFGWRGYALPRLQASRSAVSASLIIGVLWGLWHVPMWWKDLPVEILARMLLGIACAILYTWVYNNTKGSLLMPVLYHAAGNTARGMLQLMGVLSLPYGKLSWVVSKPYLYAKLTWAGGRPFLPLGELSWVVPRHHMRRILSWVAGPFLPYAGLTWLAVITVVIVAGPAHLSRKPTS